MPLSTDDSLEIDRLIARHDFAVVDSDGDSLAACFAPEGIFLNGDEVLAEEHAGLKTFASSE